jgi:TPR repeat protein
MLIAVAGLGFGLGAAALVFVLRSTGPSPQTQPVEHTAEQSASSKPAQTTAPASGDHAASPDKSTKLSDRPVPSQAATIEHSPDQSAPSKPADQPPPTPAATVQHRAEQSAPPKPPEAPAPARADNRMADIGKPAATAQDTAKPSAPAVAVPAANNNPPANVAAPQPGVSQQAALEHPAVPPPPTLAANISIDDAIKASAAIMRMYAYALRRHDYGKAAEIARNLAAKNNPVGFFELGVLNLSGELGSKDPAAARKYFSEAAKLGDWNSAELLAQLLENGAGGPQDIESAKQLYLFAARNGNADADRALARLGLSGERGLTVGEAYNNIMAGKDLEASWQRLNEQIAARSSGAICLAGWIYGNGASVPRDVNRAFDLFKAGGQTNNPSCIWGLSRTALGGLPSLPKSDVSADVLLHIAVEGLGPERSKGLTKEMDALEKRMSADEKARAQDVLKEFLEAAAPSTDAAESKSGFSPQAWQSAPRAQGDWSREVLAEKFTENGVDGIERQRVLALLGDPGYLDVRYDWPGDGASLGSSATYRLNGKNDHVLDIEFDSDNKVNSARIEARACVCDECGDQPPPVPSAVVDDVVIKKYPRKWERRLSIAQFEALLGRTGKRSFKVAKATPLGRGANSDADEDTEVRYRDVWRIDGGAPNRFLASYGSVRGRDVNPQAIGNVLLHTYAIITMLPECLAP